MRPYIPFAVFLALFGLGGLAHGLWTNRWTAAGEPLQFAQKLQNVPSVIGDWELTSESKLNERELQIGNIVGYISRRYTHRGDGNVVALLMVCGKPGPISVHTPDVCYGGAGYQLIDDPAVWQTASERPAVFRVGVFRKNLPAEGATYLRIFWSWSPDGIEWTAPKHPRISFAMHPALYKMYVIETIERSDMPLENSPATKFISEILRVLH
ncbi:MAG: hypothetical protein C4296_03980 [Gemmataceae bacterium]